jgi:hypothetical protein
MVEEHLSSMCKGPGFNLWYKKGRKEGRKEGKKERGKERRKEEEGEGPGIPTTHFKGTYTPRHQKMAH